MESPNTETNEVATHGGVCRNAALASKGFVLAPQWGLFFGMLAALGFLWLSEQFRWFPFNQHKGWTVLIAMALVGAVLMTLMVGFLVAVLLRRRVQFSLRFVLVTLVCVAVPCSWFSAAQQQASRQKDAVIAIKRGEVEYDFEHDRRAGRGVPLPPPVFAWLSARLGTDFLADVVSASVTSNSGMAHLKSLPRLQRLGIFNKVSPSTTESVATLTGLEELTLENVYVTADQFGFVCKLRKLKTLAVQSAPLTDAATKNLRGLTSLASLRVNDTMITDAGFEDLKGLQSLEKLDVKYNRITGEGLRHLKGLPGLRTLDVRGTLVNDSGLASIADLPHLENLYLVYDKVTDDGLKSLRKLKELQDLQLDYTLVTDAGLEYLKEMVQLRKLGVWHTHVTREGVNRLRKALPLCQVEM